MVRMKLHHWTEWSKPTIYEKLNGVNLNRIERMLIDSVLAFYEHEENSQLQLDFAFDQKNGLISLP